MWELITADTSLPFTVSLIVVVIFAVLEGVTSLVGAGLSEMVDALLPDMSADLHMDVDADVDADMHADGGGHVPLVSQFLGWLRVGEVPVMMLLVIFLTVFGLSGLSIQAVMRDLTGSYLSAGVASIPALAISLPSLHFLGGALAVVLPKDETEAVSTDSFVGREATITLGTARHGSPAEAKLQDEFGQTHYFLVEPEVAGVEYAQGTVVRLTERDGAVFRATQ